MEKFLNIDWTPALEDILNSTFVNDERLEKESVMYKILAGTFVDPFVNIDNDYKNISAEALQELEDISSDEKDEEPVEAGQDAKSKVKPETGPEKRSYVPGIVKPVFKFPKMSRLTQEQQALCLRVLLRFSESDKPKLTQAEREELQTYVGLQQSISQEQTEFYEFAKSKWSQRHLKLVCEDYINLRWKSKLQNVTKLPRYYTEAGNIPFTANKNIIVNFCTLCSQMGNLPKIILPTFAKPFTLRANSEDLEGRFPPTNYTSKRPSVCYKLPVSEDQTCQKLAEENDVDLVISSSGLNCLVNNIGPSYSNSWILPLVIREHNGRSVAYIDKPLPPSASTIPEKNTWVYKYILRRFLVHAKHPKSKRISNSTQFCDDDDIFGNVYTDQLLKIEEECDGGSINNDIKPQLNVSKGNDNVNSLRDRLPKRDDDEHSVKTEINYPEPSSSSFTTNTIDDGSGTKEEPILERELRQGPKAKKQKRTMPEKRKNTETPGENVSYRLFTIGPKPSDESELLKDNVVDEYRLLVRTKTDGFENLSTGETRLLMLAPKLEHQVDFGAEAVTLEESLRQWVSLIFRPETYLARVRISAETSEVLQIERRTAVSISNEVKRLHSVKAEDSLTVLHNVVQCLSGLGPGRYVLRHTVRNGAFATVYKETEISGKNVFDLHTVCGQEFHTLPSTSWLPIDKIVPNPMLKCFGRMPAMFYPMKNPIPAKNRKNMNKKATKAVVRRSLRNKKGNS